MKALVNITILAIISIFFCTCESTLINHENLVEKDALWESKLFVVPSDGDMLPNLITKVPISDHIAMIGYTGNGSKFYAGLNANSGAIEWISSDDNYPSHLIPARHSVQSGRAIYFYSVEEQPDQSAESTSLVTPFQAYDIQTGMRLFKKIYPRVFGSSVALLRSDGKYFVSLEANSPSSDGTFSPSFWVSEYPNFDSQQQLAVPLVNYFIYADGSKSMGTVSDFIITQGEGDKFLIYMVREPKFDQAPDIGDPNSIDHINCYNLTKGEWVYSKKSSPIGGGVIAVDGDNIFWGQPGGLDDDISGLRCFDWKTGDLKWFLSERTINPNIQISLSYASYDKSNQMIVTNEIGFVYGIDSNTGSVKWKSEGIGSETSPILIHNGVAYSVGAFVHGIDVLTGKHLMRAKCPSEGKKIDGHSVSGFLGDIGMSIRQDGKPIIIARNNLYAYGFEGVR